MNTPSHPLLRALNFVRKEDTLTYVGLRLFSEDLSSENRSQWVDEYLKRTLLTKRPHVYREFQSLKNIDEKDQPEFRSCHIGSPLTTLAEAWLLGSLADLRPFRSPTTVYSYLWPRSHKRSQIFDYFLEGYRRREVDVALALTQLEDSVALVTDLRKFYPTAQKDMVLQRFRTCVDVAKLRRPFSDFAIDTVQAALAAPAVGIPIGSPLGHLLGNLALAKVDEELAKSFPGRYFRYVDDIVLVIDRAAVSSTLASLRNIVEGEGFELNESKTDEVSKEDWLAHVEQMKSSEKRFRFRSLLGRLRVFLARRPEEFEALKASFNSAGISLPFSRLKAVATQGRYRRFIKAVLKAWPRSEWLTLLRDDGRRLLNETLILRAALLDEVERLKLSVVPSHGMRRRWFVQHYRFVMNRLLYLVDRSSHAKLLEMCPDIEELFQIRLVLRSFISRSATDLLRFPGPSTTTFAQFCVENPSGQVDVQWPDDVQPQHRDGAALLAIYGVCSPPDEWIQRFENRYDQALLRFAAGQRALTREFHDFSYIDEVRTLQLRTPRERMTSFLTSRLYDEEDVVLEGLALDGGYGS